MLGAVKPNLLVSVPPYGVGYEPAWRKHAGVNRNKAKLGRVANDDRADWREAWALFPGSVAYVWHAGRHASTVQASLEATGFEVRSQIIWAKDRFALSRGIADSKRRIWCPNGEIFDDGDGRSSVPLARSLCNLSQVAD